jgi:rhodanese-related sulfurtransferase
MKNFLATVAAIFATVGFGFGEVKDVSVEQAVAQLQKDPKTVVVDIRTPQEFAAGHIKGAINLNMRDEDFAEKLAKLDKDKTYLMHCASGGRSGAVIPIWNDLKFKKVMHLKAGFMGWKSAEQPVVIPKKKAKTK